MSTDALVHAFADAAANVIGSLLGADGTAIASDAAAPPRWIIRLSLSGALTTTMHLGVPAAEASALAKAVMALDEEPTDDSVIDTLTEVCGQAIGSISQSAEFKGLTLAGTASVQEQPAGDAALYRVQAGDSFSGSLYVWRVAAEAASLARPAMAAAPAQAPVVEPMVPPNLDVILDIDLPLAVRFGETEMTLASLTRLAPGSIIDLGRSPDDPVDVLVNGRLIARAEVVVVSGNYGVRITEVISPADRLRSVSI